MTNKEIAKAWFAAIDANNFDEIRKLMAPDHSFKNPMTPAPAGPEDHIGMMQMMTGAFKGAHRLEQLVSEGEWIAVYGTWSGKHTGEFNGIRATGNDVQFSWIDMFHVVDGKVAEEFFEMNPMSIMAQIGAGN